MPRPHLADSGLCVSHYLWCRERARDLWRPDLFLGSESGAVSLRGKDRCGLPRLSALLPHASRLPADATAHLCVAVAGGPSLLVVGSAVPDADRIAGDRIF